MTATLALAIVLPILALVVGVALGWYLRRATSWCPQCGDRLTCQSCGSGASWAPRPSSERSLH
jgi:hypothetical protein